MKIARPLLFGLLIWMVPFVTAFPFYSQTGELSIDVFLFKSIMFLTLVLTSSFLSVIHFKKTKSSGAKANLIAGLVWLLILIPIAEMNTSDYLQQIGMRYLVVPIIMISMGRLNDFSNVSF